MENNKYTLEPYTGINSRYQCPSCHKKGEFSQYVNVNTGEHLHPSVGMCNRVIKCGYHYPPKQYFEANKSLGITYTQISHFKPQIKAILKPQYISSETVASTLETPSNASFIKFLENKYGEAETKRLYLNIN